MAEERPEYRVTQIDGWHMTGSIDTFRRGATAFRNARDSAKRHRDSFIQAANARAVKALAVILEDPVERHEETSDHPEMPEMQRPKDCSAHTGRKDADQTLQQQIAEDRQHALQDDTGAVALAPQYLYTEGDSPNRSQELGVLACDDPSPSFTSTCSLTTFTTDPVQPKRSRDPVSPLSDSKRIHSSKDQTRPSAAPRTTRPRRATVLAQTNAGNSG